MELKVIKENSPHLDSVKKLGSKNTATLGFLPEGAFDDYASKGNIIVALNKNNKCVAYVLYRISYGKVSIVHLCVDENYRGQNIAKRLVDFLSNCTKNLKGIGLYCRRDYNLNNMWAKLGFIAIDDKVGRSKDGKLLTYWWRSHNKPTLFSEIIAKELSSKINVVIDANILIDIKNSSDSNSQSLLADWLQEEIILLITKETYNEIERINNREKRKEYRLFASEFDKLEVNIEKFDKNVELVKQIFSKDNISINDESDIRQLSWAISGNVQFFVTKDRLLLNKSDLLYDRFGISVMRPSNLVRRIDEILDESKYQPVRLAGSNIEINHVKNGSENILKRSFLCYNQGETENEFLSSIRSYLANTELYDVYIVRDNQNDPLALLVYDKSSSSELTVPLFRVAENDLASTLVRYLTKKIILDSIKNNNKITLVTESYMPDFMRMALIDNGFLNLNDNKWIKYSFKGFVNKGDLLNKLSGLNSKNVSYDHIIEIKEYINQIYIENDKELMFELEKLFWPVKIMDIGVPNYLVPIKPHWAIELFDEKMARSTLFGVSNDLILRNENVYYRSRKPNPLVKSARILWYVSDGNNYGSKKLRGCSHLNDIYIEYPKKLYEKYKRLGVYNWNDVYKTAKKNLNKKIMAIKFSNTELFDYPISWNSLKQIMSDLEGRKASIQAPVKINDDTFKELYTIANGGSI